ncbi:MAG: transcriptional regulator, BadM/Rrf2 family [Chloroflexi bacterium]|nr:transcriptional regulator, BadM/Rrf2 family [Chloroflexota bacterium]
MRLDLTKRGDYAIRAMLALARSRNGSLQSVSRIAADMAIPRQFLPEVMLDLGRAGLVDAVPGRSGGYRLRRPATDITLLDVVEAVEGDSRRRTCILRGGPCGTDTVCEVHEPFVAAQGAMLAALDQATLADLRSSAGAAPDREPGGTDR